MPEPRDRARRAQPGRRRRAADDDSGPIAIPDLDPDENPALEDKAPETVKKEVSESEDTSTEATESARRGRDDHRAGEGVPGLSGRDAATRSSTSSTARTPAGPPRAAGGMGVSSERVGPAGPGQEATDGAAGRLRARARPDDETPPEQSPGGPRTARGPAAGGGLPQADPRSD